MDQIQREEQKKRDALGETSPRNQKEDMENRVLNAVYSAVRDAMAEEREQDGRNKKSL